MGSHLHIAAFVLALACISCGTFGSYTVPPEAHQAAETDRFLDRALVEVDFGPPGGGDRRDDTATTLVIGCEELEIDGDAGSSDGEQRTDREQTPEVETRAKAQRGFASSSAPFKTVLPPAGDGSRTKAKVRVTIPSVVVALQGVHALEDGENEDGAERSDASRLELAASRSLATAAALRSLSRARNITDASRRRLGGRLCADATTLIAGQHEDGHWGDEGEVTLNVHALRALVELRAAGISVPTSSLQRAADHLLGRLEELDRLDDAQGRASRAQIFATLALLPTPAKSVRYEADLPRLAESLVEGLADSAPDVTALAYTVVGLARYERRYGNTVHHALLWEAARRLWQRRHEETPPTPSPEWFEADGGELQVTAVALEALYELDREWFEASRREVLRQMITAREPNGGWGRPWRTAAAVRALLLINPVLSRSVNDGVVVVRLGERNLERVVIDDPVAASGALAAIEVDATGEIEDQLEVSVESDVPAIVLFETEPAPSDLTD